MIAVAGGKGGCGKTTTTACLARAMADAGGDPVIVDGDLDMPDLHVVAGGRPTPGLPALGDGVPLAEVAQTSLALPGVRLVAAGDEPTVDLEQALGRLRMARDSVLVDTPAGASPDVAEPLRAADATVIVSTPTRRSLVDAAKTAAMARALDAPVVAAVVTRSDGTVDPRPLLGCDAHDHVPAVEDPLTDERIRRAYAALATRVGKRNV